MQIFLLSCIFLGSNPTVQLWGKASHNKKSHSKLFVHQNCLYCLKTKNTHRIWQELLYSHSETSTFLDPFSCSHHHNFCKTVRDDLGHFRNDSSITANPQLQFDHKKKLIESYCRDSTGVFFSLPSDGL